MNKWDISDYVKIIDGALKPEICQQLIETFESNVDSHKKIEEEDRNSFIELDLTKNNINQDSDLEIIKVINYAIQLYGTEMNLDSSQLPVHHAFESFVIHKYPSDTGYSSSVIDIPDGDFSKRILSFSIYLNTLPKNSGNRIFYMRDTVAIEPLQGSLVVHPSNWMYVYDEQKSAKDKYILKTYLSYI